VSRVNGFKLFNDTQDRTGQQVALLEFLTSTDSSNGGDNREQKTGKTMAQSRRDKKEQMRFLTFWANQKTETRTLKVI